MRALVSVLSDELPNQTVTEIVSLVSSFGGDDSLISGYWNFPSATQDLVFYNIFPEKMGKAIKILLVVWPLR